jgi:anti-sigma B factor antagonist
MGRATGETAAVIRLSGGFDLRSATGLRSRLLRELERCRDLCLDLSDLDYIDSAGVATLVEIQQVVKKTGAVLTLRSPSAAALKLFRLVRLGSVFSFED